MMWRLFIFLGVVSLVFGDTETPFFTLPHGKLFVKEKVVRGARYHKEVPYFPLFSKHLPQLKKYKKYSATPVDGDILLIVDDEVLCVAHYFHMMEHLMGTWNFLTHQNPDEVKQIILCFKERSPQDFKWVGLGNDTTLHLLTSVFPRASISLLQDLPKKLILKAKNIHISSRIRSHGIPEAGYLNMNGSVAGGYSPEKMRALRDRVFHAMGVQMTPRQDQLRITYCKRIAPRLPRELAPSLEKELLEKIRQTGHALQIVDFATLSFQEQLQTVANTDLLIGAHGNGLTHLLFLPDDGAILEYYEGGESAFFRFFARCRGVRYYGNSHDHWERETNLSLENRPPFQENITGIDIEGTLELIASL